MPPSPNHRRLRRTLAAALVTAGLGSTALVGPSAGAGGEPSVPASTLGMKPNPSRLDADALAYLEAWLDRPLAWTIQMAGRDSERDMTGSAWGHLLAPDAVLPRIADRTELVLTVPLAFGRATATSEAGRAEIRRLLETTASGEHDDAYRRVAQALVAGGYPDAVVRLGHEMSGYWFPWSAQGNADAFVAAYRHVHDVMQEVAPRLRFDWNVARLTFIQHGIPAYPGDAYVDVIGMDTYYTEGNLGDWDEERWQKQYLRIFQAQRDFAIEHGKPVGYAEWALRGVDEPEYIRRMHAWFASLPDTGPGRLLFQSYFNIKRDHALAYFPRSAAEYRRLFGGAIPDAPTTTPPPTTTTPDAPTTTGPSQPPTTTTPDAPTTTGPDRDPEEPFVPPAGTVRVSVGDARLVEGDRGTRRMQFAISLDDVSDETIVVYVATRSGQARAGSDFRRRPLTRLVIEPGARNASFAVRIRADRRAEANERLVVVLRRAVGARVGDGSAVGVIVDDD